MSELWRGELCCQKWQVNSVPDCMQEWLSSSCSSRIRSQTAFAGWPVIKHLLFQAENNLIDYGGVSRSRYGRPGAGVSPHFHPHTRLPYPIRMGEAENF